jgi:glycosyltransferase involved in cell wall biosynthesis
VRFHRYEPGLRARNVHMTVFAGTAWPENGSQAEAAPGVMLPVQDVDGIPVYRVQFPPGNVVRDMHRTHSPALVEFARKRRPDVIQFLSLSLYNIPAFYRLWRLGIPLIFTYTMLGEWASNPVKRAFQQLYIPRPFQWMDCIVVSSSVMRDGLREIGISRRIEIIPNGLNLQRFTPVNSHEERDALRQQLNLPVDADILMFVGSISPRKGLDVLVQAWALLAQKYPRAHLVLVGPAYHEIRPGSALSEFEARINDGLERSGAKDRVIFTGSVKNVEAYLRAADVFVFPSRQEGMPNVVPEAFGCGVPAILTPFTGLPAEFGRAGEQYELVERTPEALAQAMCALLDSPERRQQLRQNARQWVEAELDVERSLDQYTALYREYAKKK